MFKDQQPLVTENKVFAVILRDFYKSIERQEEVLKNGKVLLSYLKSGQYAHSAKPIANLVSPATHWELPVGGSPTYEELVATGKLDLIQPQSLRAALFEFNKAMKGYISANEKLHVLTWSNMDNLIEIEELGLSADPLIPSLQAKLDQDLMAPRTFLESVFAVTGANSHLNVLKRTQPKAEVVMVELNALD